MSKRSHTSIPAREGWRASGRSWIAPLVGTRSRKARRWARAGPLQWRLRAKPAAAVCYLAGI